MTAQYSELRVIDSHTGGEPTRLVIDGFPDLGTGNMSERRERFSRDYDDWRKAIILEPRGNDVLVGALLCEPVSPQATAGVIFFNNCGFLNMCGHGTIGLIASLAWLGRIQPGKHLIETPVGDVTATLHEDGSVSVENVPAYRWRKQVQVETIHGTVTGDIAWGGNWFFLVNDHPFAVSPEKIPELTEYAWAIREGLDRAGIRGEHDGIIDHIELAEDGKLKSGESWRQASIIGSEFTAHFVPHGDKIVPTIRGEAWVCGDNKLILNPEDPFCWGISL